MKKVDSPMEKVLNLPINTAADPKLRYRALIGVILWIVKCTRPDILFTIIYLSRFSTYATTGMLSSESFATSRQPWRSPSCSS